MTAGEIYRTLCQDPQWARKPARVRWLAARYYAGVESLEDLRRLTMPRPVAGSGVLPPLLTHEEVEEITQGDIE